MKQLDIEVSPPASAKIINECNRQVASNCLQMYNITMRGYFNGEPMARGGAKRQLDIIEIGHSKDYP